MLKPSREVLVNEIFVASIGEPWDFESQAGENRLIGAIKAVSSPQSPQDWLLLQVSPFIDEGVEITQRNYPLRVSKEA